MSSLRYHINWEYLIFLEKDNQNCPFELLFKRKTMGIDF